MGKKVLITGMSGFVGPYLKSELESHGYEVFGLDRGSSSGIESDGVYLGDITDFEFVEKVIQEIMPNEIYHLAGFSSVKKSFEQPELAMKINVEGTRNVLEAVRKFCPNTKVLIVSSSDIYGAPKIIPIRESESVQATSPYSASRIAQEKLVDEYKDLYIVISRSFNHTGPGQTDTFVLADFTKQVVEIEMGLKEPVIHTGDLEITRDFSDVRDVVRAYYELLQKGKRGQIYNVGSGIGYNLSDLLMKIITLSGLDILVKKDPDKVRPIDIPELVANISKISADTGWIPVYSIDKTIEDLLHYWRSNLKKI